MQLIYVGHDTVGGYRCCVCNKYVCFIVSMVFSLYVLLNFCALINVLGAFLSVLLALFDISDFR